MQKGIFNELVSLIKGQILVTYYLELWLFESRNLLPGIFLLIHFYIHV